MPTPAITLGAVSLPGDLRWSDEFNWTPVARSAEYSLTGALIIEEAVRQAGQPITLEAQSESQGYIWLERATLLTLKTLAETPAWTGTLTLADGRAFVVAFREDGLTAAPVMHQTASSDLPTLPYTVTIKLQTV